MNVFIKALLFALIASIGNAIFVFGQKKSGVVSNPFIFIILSLLSCIVLLAIASLFFPRTNIKEYLSDNHKTILITGVGLFITYIGFYLLYSRFGASYYILYAVFSIVTTSIIVGVIYFKEGFNIYYALSILSSLVTILFFYLGKHKA